MEAATATAMKTVTYISDRPHFVQIIEGEDFEFNLRGRQIGHYERTAITFGSDTGNRYTALIEEDEKGVARCNGVKQPMKFEDVVNVLDNHRNYGVRFWKVGDAPNEPKPTIEELKEELAMATKVELRALLERERNTHNRPLALELITDAALRDDGQEATLGDAGDV